MARISGEGNQKTNSSIISSMAASASANKRATALKEKAVMEQRNIRHQRNESEALKISIAAA